MNESSAIGGTPPAKPQNSTTVDISAAHTVGDYAAALPNTETAASPSSDQALHIEGDNSIDQYWLACTNHEQSLQWEQLDSGEWQLQSFDAKNKAWKVVEPGDVFGDKLKALETKKMNSFLTALRSNKKAAALAEHTEAVKAIVSYLATKSKTAYAENSGTRYACVLAFKQGRKYALYGGANCDAPMSERTNEEFRNCSEQTAMDRAAKDGFTADDLFTVFLARAYNPYKDSLRAEQLCPCGSCSQRLKFQTGLHSNRRATFVPVVFNRSIPPLTNDHSDDSMPTISYTDAEAGQVNLRAVAASQLKELDLEPGFSTRNWETEVHKPVD